MRAQIKTIFTIVGLISIGLVVAVFSFANQIQSSILSGNNAPSGVADLNTVNIGSSLLSGGSGEVLNGVDTSGTGSVLFADVSLIQNTFPSNVVIANPISTGTELPTTSTGVIVASSDIGFAEIQPIVEPVVIHESSAIEPKAIEFVAPSVVAPISMEVLPNRELFTREVITEEQVIRENLTIEKVVATPKTGNEWVYIMMFSFLLAVGLKLVPSKK